MPAFVIFVRDATTNQAELDIYDATAPASAAGHPVTPLAFYGTLDVLEGPPAEGAVILQFPTMADARGWYDSSAYQAAAAHRKAGSNYRVMIVDGIAQGQ